MNEDYFASQQNEADLQRHYQDLQFIFACLIFFRHKLNAKPVNEVERQTLLSVLEERKNPDDNEIYETIVRLEEISEEELLNIIIRYLKMGFNKLADMRALGPDAAMTADLDRGHGEAIAIVKDMVRRKVLLLYAEARERFMDIPDLDIRNIRIREAIERCMEFVSVWSIFLDAYSDTIPMENSDFSGINFSGLDLCRVCFDFSRLTGADFENAQCVPEQFVYALDIFNTNLPPAFLEQVRVLKRARLAEMRGSIETTMRETSLWLEGIASLPSLVCSGRPPDLTILSKEVLAILASIVFSSGLLHRIPNIQSVSFYLDKTQFELVNRLEEWLSSQHFYFSEEVCAIERVQKMALISNRDFFETRNLLNNFSVLTRDFFRDREIQDNELQDSIRFIQFVETSIEGWRLTTERQTEAAERALADALIRCFNHAPDKILQFTPVQRLITMLDAARGRPQFVLDLTTVDLSQIPFDEKVDFTGVNIRLTSAQRQNLDERYQAQLPPIEPNNAPAGGNVPAAEYFGSPRAFFPGEGNSSPREDWELPHSNVSPQEQRQVFEK